MRETEQRSGAAAVGAMVGGRHVEAFRCRPSPPKRSFTVRSAPPQERASLEEDMKSVAVFPGSQEVKTIEREFPQLSQPDQVTLRMLDIGICGTDKEICSFEYGTP